MPTPQLISTLSELPKFDTVAFIIGIDTRIFTTLAAVSAARHLAVPLLLIDGYSNDGSFETLRSLDLPTTSYLVRMERRVHGLLIDLLMWQLNAKRVLLIDSDVEVKSPAAFNAMTASLEAEKTNDPILWGAGYAHGDHDMASDGMPHAWFPKRPWIPFALFDRARCVEMLNAKSSFEAKHIGNEFRGSWIANLLVKRAYFTRTQRWALSVLAPFRGERRGQRAAFYIYDTGALIYEAAESRSWTFADIGGTLIAESVAHYDGATRSAERSRWQGHSDAELRLLDTLRTQYAVELS